MQVCAARVKALREATPQAVHRLALQGLLRRMLATTNPIESTFSVVETVVS